MASLIDSRGRRFTIPSDQSTTVGRELDNDIVLEDESVSRHHATLMNARGRYYVRDLESSNGTFLSGRRITDAELSDGGPVRFGNVELKFQRGEFGLASAPSVFCTKCGGAIPSQARVCPHCGGERFVASQRDKNVAVTPFPLPDAGAPSKRKRRLKTLAAVIGTAAVLGVFFVSVPKIGRVLKVLGSPHSESVPANPKTAPAGNIMTQATGLEVPGASLGFEGNWGGYTSGTVYSPSDDPVDSVGPKPEATTFEIRNGTVVIEFVLAADPKFSVVGAPKAWAPSPDEIVSRVETESFAQHVVDISHYKLEEGHISYMDEQSVYNSHSGELLAAIRTRATFMKLEGEEGERFEEALNEWQAKHHDVDVGHVESPAENRPPVTSISGETPSFAHGKKWHECPSTAKALVKLFAGLDIYPDADCYALGDTVVIAKSAGHEQFLHWGAWKDSGHEWLPIRSNIDDEVCPFGSLEPIQQSADFLIDCGLYNDSISDQFDGIYHERWHWNGATFLRIKNWCEKEKSARKDPCNDLMKANPRVKARDKMDACLIDPSRADCKDLESH